MKISENLLNELEKLVVQNLPHDKTKEDVEIVDVVYPSIVVKFKDGTNLELSLTTY